MISTSTWPVCGTSSAGLKMHAFPQTQRRKHLPRRDRHREVERRDDARHADRATEAHRPLVAQLARHGVAEQPASFGRRVVRRVDAFLDVAARLGERLAHLARHEVGDLFLPLRHDVADAAQHVAARRRRRAAPDLEAALRRLDGRVDVRRRRTSGNGRSRRDASAGFEFSKYSPLIGGTQSPPMKFLKVFMSVRDELLGRNEVRRSRRSCRRVADTAARASSAAARRCCGRRSAPAAVRGSPVPGCASPASRSRCAAAPRSRRAPTPEHEEQRERVRGPRDGARSRPSSRRRSAITTATAPR